MTESGPPVRLAFGCSGPSTFSRIASARSKSGRAPARSPWSRNRTARLLRIVAVMGCSGPNTFSRIASARSKSLRAPARSPWSRNRTARLLRTSPVSGCSGPGTLVVDLRAHARGAAVLPRGRPGDAIERRGCRGPSPYRDARAELLLADCQHPAPRAAVPLPSRPDA